VSSIVRPPDPYFWLWRSMRTVKRGTEGKVWSEPGDAGWKLQGRARITVDQSVAHYLVGLVS
jgi:hypothetical protein